MENIDHSPPVFYSESSQGYADDRDVWNVNKPIPDVPPSSPVAQAPFVGEGEPQHVDIHETSADESSNDQMEQYWGLVEPLPLELREISPPPISSPSRQFVSSLTTLVEETPPENKTEDSSETTFSSEDSELSDRQFNSVGIQTQTSFTNVACPSRLIDLSADTKSTSSSPTELDWEQFVLVEHLEDKTQQREELSSSTISIPDAGSTPVPEVADSLEERLQKRMKNWPRYLQNLIEAQHS